MDKWSIFIAIISILTSAGVSVYALHHNRKLKGIDISENEKARRFELEKFVTLKSMEATTEYWTVLNKWNIFYVRSQSEGKKEIEAKDVSQMLSELEESERYFPFIPDEIRDDLKSASGQINCLNRNYGKTEDMKSIAIADILTKLKISSEILEGYISKLNLLNQP
ncbi:MAG: hypothetical protein ABIE07_04680 [Candidatus Zixiibacteriota bacterium]